MEGASDLFAGKKLTRYLARSNRLQQKNEYVWHTTGSASSLVRRVRRSSLCLNRKPPSQTSGNTNSYTHVSPRQWTRWWFSLRLSWQVQVGGTARRSILDSLGRSPESPHCWSNGCQSSTSASRQGTPSRLSLSHLWWILEKDYHRHGVYASILWRVHWNILTSSQEGVPNVSNPCSFQKVIAIRYKIWQIDRMHLGWRWGAGSKGNTSEWALQSGQAGQDKKCSYADSTTTTTME